MNSDTVDDLNEQIVESVRKCVDEVRPKLDPVKKREPWDDPELDQQIRDLRKISKHEDVRKQQKNIKKRRMELKNNYYREMADTINDAANAREVEKEFALAKKFSAIKKFQKS